MQNIAPPKVKPSIAQAKPRRTVPQFRYALAQHLVERRPDGWWFAKAWMTSQDERHAWQGPFTTVQDACAGIARFLCSEVTNPHAIVVGPQDQMRRPDPRSAEDAAAATIPKALIISPVSGTPPNSVGGFFCWDHQCMT